MFNPCINSFYKYNVYFKAPIFPAKINLSMESPITNSHFFPERRFLRRKHCICYIWQQNFRYSNFCGFLYFQMRYFSSGNYTFMINYVTPVEVKWLISILVTSFLWWGFNYKGCQNSFFQDVIMPGDFLYVFIEIEIV